MCCFVLLDILVFGVFILIVGGNILGVDTLAQPLTEFLGGDAALVRRQVGGGVAVRQVGTESGHEEEFTDDEDQRDSADAEEVLDGGFMPDDHVAGDGIKQHLQAAAGAVLGQHLDELDADDDVQRPFQKRPDLHIVAVEQQAGHPLDQRYDREQQPDEHQPGKYDLQQGGRLNDVVLQGSAAVALHAGSLWFEHDRFSFTSEIWGNTQTFSSL